MANGIKERLARMEERVDNLKESVEGLTKLAIEIKNTVISQHEQITDKVNCVNNDFTAHKNKVLGFALAISFTVSVIVGVIAILIK